MGLWFYTNILGGSIVILIKDGRVIDPKSGRDEILDIKLRDGLIAGLGKFQVSDDYDEIIDAKGKIISPGFIDVHVHFRDPGFTHKEDIITGAKSAAAGGYTTVVAMANTNPIIDNVETLNYVNEKAKEACIEVLSVGAISQKFLGEDLTDMNALKEAGAVGFTDDGMPLSDEKLLYNAMIAAKKLNMPLSLHEENPKFITQMGINKGTVSQQLNYEGAPDFSEYSMVARDVMLALNTKVRLSIQHISSGKSVQLVKLAQSMGADVWAEVTPQHFSATEDLVLEKGSLAKVNPPLRREEDRYEIIQGLKDNVIQMIATDHAPHTLEEKSVALEKAPSGMIGLETSLGLGITNLVRTGHLTMFKFLEKLTLNPANFYDLDRACICEGKRADLVIFDEYEQWEVKEFKSKSANSPFIGQKLYGKVKYTISQGKIVYRD